MRRTGTTAVWMRAIICGVSNRCDLAVGEQPVIMRRTGTTVWMPAIISIAEQGTSQIL